MHSEGMMNSLLSCLTSLSDGATHTIAGHPLDTIRSKMQIQSGYTSGGSISIAKSILRNEGMIGFFRGCIPPLWGSMVYRGVMISSYEFAYTYLEKNNDKESFVRKDLGLGLRPIVPMSATFASICRGVFESPIEYAKVMGQTGKVWRLSEVYRGVEFQIVRTTALMIPIFSVIDMFRQRTDYLKSYTGNFVVTFVVAGGTYCVCAPLETLKNLAQTGTPRAGASVAERIAFLGGVRGLFRGVWPGTLCGGLRNACAMMTFLTAQKWATQLGLR